MLALSSSSRATKRSFSDASGSSRILRSWARWLERSRCETSSMRLGGEERAAPRASPRGRGGLRASAVATCFDAASRRRYSVASSPCSNICWYLKSGIWQSPGRRARGLRRRGPTPNWNGTPTASNGGPRRNISHPRPRGRAGGGGCERAESLPRSGPRRISVARSIDAVLFDFGGVFTGSPVPRLHERGRGARGAAGPDRGDHVRPVPRGHRSHLAPPRARRDHAGHGPRGDHGRGRAPGPRRSIRSRSSPASRAAAAACGRRWSTGFAACVGRAIARRW